MDLRAYDLVVNGFRKVTRSTIGSRNPVDVSPVDAAGKVAGEAGYVGQLVQIVDENGDPVENATTIITTDYFSLKADVTAATANTDVVTVSQTGIKKATIANPHQSIIMYVWFGADPAAAAQYVLYPGMTFSDIAIDNKGDMRYKSSAAGGLLIYDLRG